MPRYRRRNAASSSRTSLICLALLVALIAALGGCATGANAEEQSEEEVEISRLEQLLSQTRDDLASERARSASLAEQAQALEARVAELESEIRTTIVDTAVDASDGNEEMEQLRAEREALLLDMERLSSAAEVAAARAAEAEADAEEARARIATLERELDQPGRAGGGLSGTESGEPDSARESFADALAGLGGFRRLSTLNPDENERLAARLGVSGSGLSVDSSGERPVLYDSSLDFESPLAYLMIVDPAADRPELILSVQYISEVRPLYAQTAFIGIRSPDPIDPADPIIFTGAPERETDGSRIRESFSRTVDRALLRRISAMLSARDLSVTFVGPTGRESFQPGETEREAMSRVLFAFIDLGGFRSTSD